MSDIFSAPAPQTEADGAVAVAQMLAEIQTLRERMDRDQADIERLKAETRALKAETRALLASLRGMMPPC